MLTAVTILAKRHAKDILLDGCGLFTSLFITLSRDGEGVIWGGSNLWGRWGEDNSQEGGQGWLAIAGGLWWD